MNTTNNESTLLSDTLLNYVSFRIATRIAENVFGTTNFVVEKRKQTW